MAKSINSNTELSSFSNCGVNDCLTSITLANADMFNDKGATTFFCFCSSDHTVLIERESFPTGIQIPNSLHNSLIADTVLYNFTSSPGSPHAAIQFAERLISSILRMRAAVIFKIASDNAIRPEAGASIMAIGLRSPIAIASPT